MRILILGMAGLKDEPEDPKYLDMWLSSLSKHIVPNFDTKAILFNSCTSSELTKKQVEDYGLSDVVEVLRMDEFGLPEHSVNFMENQHWFARIGLIMNMMKDYAARHDCFGAEWVFHTDTDLGFLPSFHDKLMTIDGFVQHDNAIMITNLGDAFPARLVNGKEGEAVFFEDPPRMALFEIAEEDLDHTFFLKRPVCRKVPESHQGVAFCTRQLKIRNDFAGLTRQAVMVDYYELNWSNSWHHYSECEAGKKVDEWIESCGPDSLRFVLNDDKGGDVAHKLHMRSNITTVQCSGNGALVLHYASGWTNDALLGRYKVDLEQHYKELEHLWGERFKDIPPAEGYTPAHF